jgi:hypothetical protein
MSVTFPNTASILYRQETSPWYNGFNAPGSGSDGQLTFDNMDYNWYGLNSASYQTIEVIKGAAYTGSSNTFTEPQTFTSNVGISGSLTGSMARFSGQVISDYPGVGFLGTASWAANAITSSVFVTTSSISASYASSSTSASFIYIASNNSTNIDYTLVFKNSPGALDNFYQLAADGTNGPYYNPSTNVLGGLGGLTVSASKGVFTSITGSLSGSVTGNITGTASFATQASTASYVVTAQTASYIDKVNNQNYDNGTTVVPGDFKFIAGKTAMTSGAATSSIFTVLIGKVIGTNVWINASYPTTFLTTPGQSLLQVNVSSSGQVLISGAPSDTGTIIFTGIYV